MSMSFLLRALFGTILKYKRDPYVHCSGSLKKASMDSSSHTHYMVHGSGFRKPGIPHTTMPITYRIPQKGPSYSP